MAPTMEDQNDRFNAAAEQMAPEQIQQAIQLGEACRGLLGSQEMGLAFQALQGSYYNEFRRTAPEHSKARESLYQKGKALDDIQDWLIEQAQFAHFLRSEQAAAEDPKAREQDHLNRQGFGLDENYKPTN